MAPLTESDLINSIWDEIEAEDEEWVRELELLLRELLGPRKPLEARPEVIGFGGILPAQTG
jgi:hypothetical protein